MNTRRHTARWTTDERALLRERFTSGRWTLSMLAKVHQRKGSAVAAELSHQGLLVARGRNWCRTDGSLFVTFRTVRLLSS